jgi:hypothetical protein
LGADSTPGTGTLPTSVRQAAAAPAAGVPTSGLAFTGTNVEVDALVGAALLALGTLVLQAQRRRRSRRT